MPEVKTPTPVGVPVVTGLESVGVVRVGVVSDRLDAKYVEPTDPAVAGMAFSTDDTKKLSTVTKSLALAADVRTTVVPFDAV